MSIETQIMQIASDIVADIQSRKPDLEAKKRELEAKLRDVKAKLHSVDLAAQRLSAFVHHRNGRLQCPSCWIEDEAATDLTAVPSDDRNDKFRCPECGYHFEFSV